MCICACYIFFIRSSVGGHVGCFHILAIVNNALRERDICRRQMVLGVSCRGTAQANDPGLLHQETTDVLCCLFPPGEWRVGPILLRVRPLAAAPLGKRRSTKTSTWRSTVQVRSPTCRCSWSPVTTSLSPAPHTQGMWEEGCSSCFPPRDPP